MNDVQLVSINYNDPVTSRVLAGRLNCEQAECYEKLNSREDTEEMLGWRTEVYVDGELVRESLDWYEDASGKVLEEVEYFDWTFPGMKDLD